MKAMNEEFCDDIIGKFLFYESSYRNYYEAIYKDIKIHIENKSFISDIHKLIINLDNTLDKIKNYILDQFLEIDNFIDKPEISKNEILDDINLACIMMQEPHKFIFWVDCSFLQGHCICIYGNINEYIQFSNLVIEG